LGAVFSFGVHFFGVFSELINPTGRFMIKLFGMGMLGASLYCSKWWCVDMECCLKDKSILPHMFDFVGYSTVIVGGGVTGIVLYLTVKLGITLTITSSQTVELRLPASLILGFCGGLFHFQVRDMLADMAQKIGTLKSKSEN